MRKSEEERRRGGERSEEPQVRQASRCTLHTSSRWSACSPPRMTISGSTMETIMQKKPMQVLRNDSSAAGILLREILYDSDGKVGWGGVRGCAFPQ